MARLRKPPNDPVEIVNDAPADEPITIELDDSPEEVEIEIPEVVTKVTASDDDDAVKKALEATKHAEELQRNVADANRRADEANRLLRERDEELTRERGDRVDAEYNSVLTAIAAEQGALEQAKALYSAAASNSDWTAAGEAQSAIARASARIDRLEDNKTAFEQRREQDKKAPPQRQAAPDFEAQISNLPSEARSWLRSHPEYWSDSQKNRQIQSLHGYLVNVKHIPEFSKEYFDEIDVQLGLKAPAVSETRETTQQPSRRSMPVSAPVSRDAPNPSGQRQSSRSITLTAEQRQIAKHSFSAPDMTDEQKERLYALNLQKLNRMRANGEYRHTTEETR